MNEATRKRGLICYIIFCSLQFLLGKLTWKELLASLQIISTGIYGTVRNWVQNSKWRDKIFSKLTRYQYLTFWLTSFVCMISEENNKSFIIQNLTNQLVELERHFNNLEMNRSSETGRVASNRRAVYSNKTRSRYLTVRPSCYKFHIHLVIIINWMTNNRTSGLGVLRSFQSDYVAHKCM